MDLTFASDAFQLVSRTRYSEASKLKSIACAGRLAPGGPGYAAASDGASLWRLGQRGVARLELGPLVRRLAQAACCKRLQQALLQRSVRACRCASCLPARQSPRFRSCEIPAT